MTPNPDSTAQGPWPGAASRAHGRTTDARSHAEPYALEDTNAAHVTWESVGLKAGTTVILDGVTLSARRGEILGLLGPNGSGKSSLVALTCGLQPRYSGRLRFHLEGGAVADPGDARLDGELGVVFQNPSLDAKLSAMENLRLACSLARLPRAGVDSWAREALELVGLADVGARKVGEFSGGMKRRLDLARVLLAKPRLLLLDEPTTGVDEASFRAFWSILDSYRASTGTTVVVATHRPEEAEKCTRVALFSKGRVSEVSSPAELKRRLARDVVELSVEASDTERVARGAIEAVAPLGIPSDAVTWRPGAVSVRSDAAHRLVPRLVEAYPAGTLKSVSLRAASMADVFLQVTGHTLET